MNGLGISLVNFPNLIELFSLEVYDVRILDCLLVQKILVEENKACINDEKCNYASFLLERIIYK